MAQPKSLKFRRTDAQTSRIKIEYFDPPNPALRGVYELVKKRRTLERIRQVFSPFRLPVELTIRTGSCEGVANAWYIRPAITVCYEYLNQILQSLPGETTPEGVTREDAVIGETFYVFAHEMGHATFDLFKVPMLGDRENAADHFAGYLMLHFGKDEARALIMGAAFTYNKYVQNPEVTAPLKAFSDIHGAPAQRYYNLLCLAYGAEPTVFADVVAKGYLPKARAIDCKREYDQVAYGFREFMTPHMDQQLEKQVLDKSWLPEVKAPDLSHDQP
jgi:Putative metallopeptidase